MTCIIFSYIYNSIQFYVHIKLRDKVKKNTDTLMSIIIINPWRGRESEQNNRKTTTTKEPFGEHYYYYYYYSHNHPLLQNKK